MAGESCSSLTQLRDSCQCVVKVHNQIIYLFDAERMTLLRRN